MGLTYITTEATVHTILAVSFKPLRFDIGIGIVCVHHAHACVSAVVFGGSR
jgi:hypothetical protein